MKKFLLVCLTTFFALITWAQTFTATNVDGYELGYTIVDGSEYGFTSPACELSDLVDLYVFDYTTLNVPSEVESGGTTYTVIGLGERCCEDCWMTNIVLPNNLLYIEENAFQACIYLVSLDVPNSIQYIGKHICELCDALTRVTIAEGSVAGESSITIDEGAFEDCEQIEYVYLGAGVTYLAYYALCTMSDNLVEIYSLNPTPPTCDGNAFYAGTPEVATLYVPEGKRGVYQNADVWCEFVDVQEIGITPPEVTTLAATEVGQTTVTLNATIVKGTEVIEEQGFEYWVSSRNVQTAVATDVSGDEMSITVEDLQTSSTYYFRAYAKTVSGTYYGDQRSFTTQSDYACYLDGFYYSITSTSQKTCAVTCISPTTLNKDVYQGEIEIPTTVEIDGETYTVTGIDDYAFCYCAGLISVEIPSSVTSMGYAAFYECTSLEKADIPSTVTSLGAYLFYDCVALKEVVIPSGFTSVPAYFCYKCSSLQEIVIPDKVKVIYDCAFCNCTNLESVTLGSAVESLGWYVFNSCNIKEIVLPNSLMSIGYLAFAKCANLESVTMSSSISSISNYAFQYCTSLKSIEFPSKLSTLGPYAFDGCTSLETADIGKTNLKTLERYVFGGCSSLKEIDIPSSVTSIGSYALGGCASLTEVVIPYSVTSMGTSAFSGCTNLRSVNIPRFLEKIDNYTFYNCTNLQSIEIPEAVTSIGSYAFRYCSSLKEIDIPSTVESVGDYAFDSCDSLWRVSVDAATIKAYAFRYTPLKELTLGDDVKEIGNYAFAYCDSLSRVSIAAATLNRHAFYRCATLKELTLGDDVPEIGSQVFFGCTSLEEVVLGKSLASIGYSSFGNCPALSSIYSLNPEHPMCEYANNGSISPFDDVDNGECVNKKTCVVYVPTGSYNDYAYADTWREFMNIIEITDLSVVTAEATDVTETSATLEGSLTEGTVPVKEKGFEYWTADGETIVVAVEGDELTAEITDLSPETTYTYRAYATTAIGTTYGEDMEFTTLEDTTGINGISANSISEVEGIYSTSGQKLNSTQKGVNIIRYSDGTVKKLYVK